ncbi:zebrafish testis-expressed 38 isoform 1-T1 [Clarias gariepinus]|uniref:zebrafish testis-expressed 38 isoform X1 n=1 Tax=Clarias gariepinus TaxID=13013 RepID=UPI00234CC799|nr:zebrafish testis-expressed 38 isoform X1 [Clarias gariepinus]
MATGLKKRAKAKQEVAEWDSLFNQELRTQEQSLVFVKRMLVLAVSSITYLRGIFPEDAYRSRYLEDLCLKVLKEDCTSPGANKIVKWLIGCFDALEKRYLQIVLIGVHRDPDDTNHVIESYQFKFKYTDNGPQMDILRNENIEMRVTIEDTKKASVLLIRKLFLLMQNLDSLPDDVYLTMKLYYYDDVTPSDYEPPGFKEGVCDSLWFEGTAVHFRVGDLQTPFHVLKVGVAAEQGRLSKLQEGEHLKDSVQDSVQEEVPGSGREDSLPSEDESAAQFKQPAKTLVKKRENKLAKRRRKEI